MKIILIDNYDSFTFNLYHYLSSLKTNVDVVRNDKITDKAIIKNKIWRTNVPVFRVTNKTIKQPICFVNLFQF